MIAMAILAEQSPNDLNFSVKTQAKSALEILVLAMLDPRPRTKGIAKYDRWRRCVSNALGRQNPQQGYVWTGRAKVQRVVAELGHSQIQSRPLTKNPTKFPWPGIATWS